MQVTCVLSMHLSFSTALIWDASGVRSLLPQPSREN